MFSHMIQINEMSYAVEQKQQQFDQQKQKFGSFEHECQVSSNLIGLVIGRSGQNLRDIQERHDCQVIIDKTEGVDSQKVLIIAKS